MERDEILKTSSGGRRRNLRDTGIGAPNITASKEDFDPEMKYLMEAVVERKNMHLAMHRVEKNKGSAGIDNMDVDTLRPYLKEHWPEIREALLTGEYKPQPVCRVEIPKPGGKGMRQLGIPTVLDRLIQQAVHQVLSPVFDSRFSESSYGFRPGRGAHMAVKAAQRYVASGKRWVVDMDLEKFFDRVNHDVLMSRIARRIKDKRILLLIRRYLQVGTMLGGLTTISREGTPQGGPLSPLLSNIILDDFDKELERRGHSFCRYADDCNVYVHTRKAGERVLESISKFLEEKLRLKVNREKSAVDRPWKRKFLGYSMTHNKEPKLKAAPQSLKRLRGKLKYTFRKGRGRNIKRFIKEDLNPVLRGWGNYFRLSEVKITPLELDEWIRRRIRCLLWRQWKRPKTRKKKLLVRGLSELRAWQSASNGRGAWWNSGASHMNEAYPKKYFYSLGLVSLSDIRTKFQLAM